ncbi:MAG: SDR family oxidoreductase [Bordetella sp.]|uniref:SDR family oxidoreductase n=1 Tax=Bordetella sp. TaxID=28081 RepID=UPI003F7C84C5
MSETIAVVTGASRGIGAALARSLLAPGVKLITLARRADADLAAAAKSVGAELEQIQVDLSDLAAADAAAKHVAALLVPGAKRYLLINNAGTVHPVAAAPAMTDGPAIAQAFNLNVTAVMLLTAHFVQAVSGLDAERRVMNISSGAGRNPTAGWGVYCATKSALDMYTRVLNQEQGERGVRAVSMAPGIVDTDMQGTIRASDPTQFPALSKFQEFKASGALAQPADVAARLVDYLGRVDFGATEIDDIRNYK